MKPADVDARIWRFLGGVRGPLKGKTTRLSAGRRVMVAQAEGVSGEMFQGAEVFQHCGFRSVLPAGTQVIILPVGGSSAHGVIVASTNGAGFSADLASGELQIFNETDGARITLRNGRLVEVDCDFLHIRATASVTVDTVNFTVNASAAVELATPTSHTTGHLSADGEITDHAASSPRTMSGMRDAFQNHDHNEFDVVGDPTGKPNQTM